MERKTIIPLTCAFLSLLLINCGEKQEEVTAEESIEHVESDNIHGEENATDEITIPEGWELTTNQEINYLAISDTVYGPEMEGFAEKLAYDYGKMIPYTIENEIPMVGAPFVKWIHWDTTSYSIFEAALPVPAGTEGLDGMYSGIIAAGQAFKYKHVGSYDQMQQPHIDLNAYFAEIGKDAIGGPWEVYVTDPGMEPDTSKWVSEIWYPVVGF